MKKLDEILSNDSLRIVIDSTVRQAVILQKKADDEYVKPLEVENAGEKFNFMQSHIWREGSHALGHVLSRAFDTYPYKCFDAIEKIVRENKSQLLGIDCQDYVLLFAEAFWDKKMVTNRTVKQNEELGEELEV